MGKQALIIRLYDLGERADDIGTEALDALLLLQQQLTSAVEGAGVGEVDGNEIALDDSEGSLWVYGPDAIAMLKAALSVVCHSPLAPGGRAILRYGDVADEMAQEESFLLADLCAHRNG
jgi:hypothetical protein